ncbi:MAG: response regulator [Luteolibacter sp.]
MMLDIEMPHMNGFDLFNSIGTWDFDVIFTTAYDKYAIKAIRFSALDYLLRPIDIPELQNAINRHIIKKDPGPWSRKNWSEPDQQSQTKKTLSCILTRR